MKQYQLIGPFTELLPMASLPVKGALSDEQLGIIKEAGILIEKDKIKSVGNFEQLYQINKSLPLDVLELEVPSVGLPGFVDAHTHICFGGSRAQDYAMRNAGKSYLEIAKAGGGIWDTVRHTRATSPMDLTKGILKRANRHLENGITTIEVKSGYGLSVAEELKMLRAIQVANQQHPTDLIATCLAAHIFPKDYEGNIADYLKEISKTLFPLLQTENLTNRIDAFIEEEAFSPMLIAPYLAQARKMGFDITLHVDQFHAGSSKVAVDFNAISADHLEASTEKEIELLANSEVIPVALPGASIGLGCAFTPARKLLDAGTSLAIASDWNPGSAPMGDLLTQAAILGTFEKLSTTEVLAGITDRAAAALGIQDRGQLAANYLADIIAFPTDDYREILYQQGQLKPYRVWKKGRLFLSSGRRQKSLTV